MRIVVLFRKQNHSLMTNKTVTKWKGKLKRDRRWRAAVVVKRYMLADTVSHIEFHSIINGDYWIVNMPTQNTYTDTLLWQNAILMFTINLFRHKPRQQTKLQYPVDGYYQQCRSTCSFFFKWYCIMSWNMYTQLITTVLHPSHTQAQTRPHMLFILIIFFSILHFYYS